MMFVLQLGDEEFPFGCLYGVMHETGTEHTSKGYGRT